MKKHRVFSLFTVIFVAFLLFQSVTIVPTGYTGVKTSFGQIQEATIQSGKLNFTIPFVQSIHTVSNKQQDKHIEAQIWGETSDKTPVYAADVIVTYQVLPEKVHGCMPMYPTPRIWLVTSWWHLPSSPPWPSLAPMRSPTAPRSSRWHSRSWQSP